MKPPAILWDIVVFRQFRTKRPIRLELFAFLTLPCIIHTFPALFAQISRCILLALLISGSLASSWKRRFRTLA